MVQRFSLEALGGKENDWSLYQVTLAYPAAALHIRNGG
jgi:hypothetical protein